MANPAGLVSGTKGVLLRNGVVICGATSNGGSVTRTLVESTNKCSEEHRTIIPNSGTVTYDSNWEGFWSSDEAFEAVVEDWKTGATASYSFVYGDSGKQDDFVAVVENLSNGYETDTPVSSSFTLKSTETLSLNSVGEVPRADFYYYFGALGTQTLRTNEIVIPDAANDDYEVYFNIGTYGFTGVNQMIVTQSLDSDITLQIYSDPDDQLNINIGGNEVVTTTDVTANIKLAVRIEGSNYTVLKDDVVDSSGTITRGASTTPTATMKFGTRQVTGGYSNGLNAVLYNVGIKPLGASTFPERLYLLDENSDATVEYYSQTQLATWINYNAANWQGTP